MVERVGLIPHPIGADDHNGLNAAHTSGWSDHFGVQRRL